MTNDNGPSSARGGSSPCIAHTWRRQESPPSSPSARWRDCGSRDPVITMSAAQPRLLPRLGSRSGCRSVPLSQEHATSRGWFNSPLALTVPATTGLSAFEGDQPFKVDVWDFASFRMQIDESGAITFHDDARIAGRSLSPHRRPLPMSRPTPQAVGEWLASGEGIDVSEPMRAHGRRQDGTRLRCPPGSGLLRGRFATGKSSILVLP